jgi:hypothetical protein
MLPSAARLSGDHVNAVIEVRIMRRHGQMVPSFCSSVATIFVARRVQEIGREVVQQ